MVSSLCLDLWASIHFAIDLHNCFHSNKKYLDRLHRNNSWHNFWWSRYCKLLVLNMQSYIIIIVPRLWLGIYLRRKPTKVSRLAIRLSLFWNLIQQLCQSMQQFHFRKLSFGFRKMLSSGDTGCFSCPGFINYTLI